MKPYNMPSTVEVDRGQVLVSGPQGVAYAMTPEAAEETSRRLKAGATIARQRRDGSASSR